MDFATGIGLIAGGIVLVTLILMGGDLRMFADTHAAIVIFGGSFAATLIRFPLSSIFHGLPLGARFAFTMRRITQRDLVDEIASLAEIARKQGPIGLERSRSRIRFWPRGSASSPTVTTTNSSGTISSGTATIFSPISTRARRSTARSATARRLSA
jgi:chemotaxis protein MotA